VALDVADAACVSPARVPVPLNFQTVPAAWGTARNSLNKVGRGQPLDPGPGPGESQATCGSVNSKLVPRCGAECTRMTLPCSSTMRLTMASPSPALREARSLAWASLARQ
jgi:hypothetical protein